MKYLETMEKKYAREGLASSDEKALFWFSVTMSTRLVVSQFWTCSFVYMYLF